MVKFAHIAPINYFDMIDEQEIHLVLAHLVQESDEYKDFYKNQTGIKILDNSGFEMYKQGKPMMDPDVLVGIGNEVGADVIVMSDYPAEPGQKTISNAEKQIKTFKEAGFGTFFVPQSKIGDTEDYIKTFKWALENKDIDLIGVSILGVPNAYGVERDNNLQRYLSRYKMLTELKKRGILTDQYKKLHFLGMVDGPNEIELVKDFHEYIYSWDSSSAVWAGINGIVYDDSPTGLLYGKLESEVDFYIEDIGRQDLIEENIKYIKGLIG